MPLSDDPAKRARQLANLRPAPPAPEGNRRRLRHGGYAEVARDRLEGKVREMCDALGADAPLRDADGELPAADHAAMMVAATAMCRLEDVTAHLATTGFLDQRTGEPRMAVLDLERRLRRDALDALERFGMTPASRAALGLDLARTVDVAQVLSEPDPERRRRMVEGTDG
jgi:hypothetical protein